MCPMPPAAANASTSKRSATVVPTSSRRSFGMPGHHTSRTRAVRSSVVIAPAAFVVQLLHEERRQRHTRPLLEVLTALLERGGERLALFGLQHGEDLREERGLLAGHRARALRGGAERLLLLRVERVAFERRQERVHLLLHLGVHVGRLRVVLLDDGL